jgi:predicted NAD-dependent protein-ADP-ribosyltransferase YbiA (DUF1768 family)
MTIHQDPSRVIQSCIEQLPKYKKVLKTGDQILLYANPMDEMFSIGMASEEIQSGYPLPKNGDGKSVG